MKPDRGWTFLLLIAIGAGVVPNAYHRSQAGEAPAAARPPLPASPAPAAAEGEPPTDAVNAHGPARHAPPAAEPKKESTKQLTIGETKLRALLAGFGVTAPETPEAAPAEGDIAALARRYREAGRGRILSLVATVPDPDSSGFDAYYDQSLDAIQRAAAGAGFLPDRFFLPWNGQHGETAGDAPSEPRPPAAAGAAPPGERAPGILIFRRRVSAADDGARRPSTTDLLVVFLVGELAKRGLHPAAFADAIDLADQLRASAADGLYVMGPHFSGAASSLRVALDQYARRHAAPAARTPPAPSVMVISGAAVDPGNQATIASAGPAARPVITYEATNIPSDQQLATVLEAIVSRLDDSSPEAAAQQIAMLFETGTQWAASLSRSRGQDDEAKGGARRQAQPRDAKVRSFRFPLHISQLRAKREQSRHDAASDNPITTLRNRLELRLDSDRESADDLPAGAALTPYTIEIMLHEQLIEIAREHFRFLGIAATDPSDLVFIAQEARKFCPGVQLFTIGSHALFSHPDLMRDLNGLVVASTYPLASLVTRRGETFANQGAEGIYNAAATLLGRMDAAGGAAAPIRLRDWRNPFDPERPGPKVWLTMLSNGAIWPLSARPPEWSADHRNVLPEIAAAAPAAGAGHRLPELVSPLAVGLYWLLLALALAHAGYFSVGYLRRRRSPARTDGSEGAKYVVVMCGCLLFTCVYWALVAFQLGAGRRSPEIVLAFAAGIGAAAAVTATLLLAIGAWLMSPGALLAPGGAPGLRRRAAWVLLSIAGTLVVAVVWAVPYLRELASARLPLEAQPLAVDLRLALARTAQPMSGVSPAAPLLCVAAGLYLWAASGFRRVRERSRLPPASPFPTGEGIWAHKLTDKAMLIWRGHSDWLACPEELIALIVVVVPCLFFWHELIPTFESPAFDPLFKVLFLLLVIAVVARAGRLVAAWRQLRRLLRRIAGHPMIDAYHRAGVDGSTWLRLSLNPEIPLPGELARAVEVAALAGAGEPVAPAGQTLSERLAAAAADLEAARMDELHGGGAAGARGPSSVAVRTHAVLFRFSGLLFTALERIWQSGRIVRADKDGEPLPLEKLAGEDLCIATAEVIVARQVITLIRYGLGRLRALMTFVSGGALLLVFAIQSYPFHPIRFVSVFAWAIALSGMGAILFVLFSVERDGVLSRMSRSRPGRIDLNAALVSKVLMYGVVPGCVLVATLFPEVGELLFSWLGPLMRAFH